MYNFSNIKFKTDHRDILNVENVTISHDSKIGLIGDNGVGKSTLLDIIFENAVRQGINISIVRQVDDKSKLYITIYEYISHKVDEAWKVKTELDIDKKIREISGGEKMLLDIQIAISAKPNIPLFEEPINLLNNYKVNILLIY